MNKIDFVVGSQFGDEGKMAVVYHLLEKNKKYTHVIRVNGGANAGHTLYHKGKKFVSHLIPCEVFYGLKSIIGNGCVLNVEQFFNELKELQDFGIKTEGLVFISKGTHIVQQKHLDEEKNESAIGTTKRGIGPAYRDKMSRTGIRAEQIKELEPYLIDMYEEFYVKNKDNEILVEGAQAFYLDIDLGDYPYVTSSNCGPGAILNNGFSYKEIRDVYGICKAYETYVGSKKFQPSDKVFEKIQELGQEYGATTGRKRQCNILDLDRVIKSSKIMGVNFLNFRKVDVLDSLEFYRFRYKGAEMDFDNNISFTTTICNIIKKELGEEVKVFFSYSPHEL